MKLTKLDYYKMIFAELELSDSIEAARTELEDFLQSVGYETRTKVPVKGSKHCLDLVAYDMESKERLAVIIGRHTARNLRIREFRQFDGDKVYLLRGNARITAEEREGINIISVMSKGSL